MKKIKTLLPIATISSIGLIIAPTIISCKSSPVWETKKIDFTPAAKLEASEYKKSSLEVAKEYFASPKCFIEDCVYARLNSINKDYLEKKADSHYSYVNYQTDFKINSISLKEVTTKHISTEDGWEHDVFGAYIDLSLTFVLNRTNIRNFSQEELEEGISKESMKTIDNETYNSNLTNYFAFIYFEQENGNSNSRWSVGLYANKDADWQCHWTSSSVLKTVHTVTRDKKDYTFEDTKNSNQDVTNSRKLENDNFREILDDLGANQSYCLSEIIPKYANK